MSCKEVPQRMTTHTDKLDFYVQLYEQTMNQVDDSHAAIAIMQEVAKDLRMEQIQSEKQVGHGGGSNGRDWPATEGQVAYLKKLGTAIPDGLTKREASALIDQAKQEVKVLPRRVP